MADLNDTFDGPDYLPIWFVNDFEGAPVGGYAEIVGGRSRHRYDAGPNGFSELFAPNFSNPDWEVYSFTGKALEVEVDPERPDAGWSRAAYAAFSITNGDGMQCQFYLELHPDPVDDVFRAVHFAYSDVNLTYDPVAHRWWRIGELGGTVLMETSPDGVSWTVQRSIPLLDGQNADDTLVFLDVGHVTSGTDPLAEPRYVYWDNVRTVVLAAGGWTVGMISVGGGPW